ncbi:MAG: hypothetical protein J6S13_06295 [Clostridia bacterium]|nr:hypothetical protein [Clostridia bacterium]
MGIFNKITNIVGKAIEAATQAATQTSEEEKRRQEEEQKRLLEEDEREEREEEEKARLDPVGKDLEWFGSEDGLKAFSEYMTVQNYILEETITKEHKEKYPQHPFGVFTSVFHKDAKLPFSYFSNLVDAIKVPALEYVGPTDMVAHGLAIQAKPFYIDDDGEPQAIEPILKPEEIVSVEINPLLNYVSNFDCFEFEDDAQGSFENKFNLWSQVVAWLCGYSKDKDIISKNRWVFSKEVYLNEFGTVRKPKGFFKKCMELAADEQSKAYFEKEYNKCD